jgi:hypothetical protein
MPFTRPFSPASSLGLRGGSSYDIGSDSGYESEYPYNDGYDADDELSDEESSYDIDYSYSDSEKYSLQSDKGSYNGEVGGEDDL